MESERGRRGAGRGIVWIGILVALVATACGGGGGETATTVADDPATGVTTTTGPGDEPVDEPPGDEPADDIGGPGDYTPGPLRFRVVNLISDPVDVYVRTTDGLVEAYLVDEAVAPGEVTGFHHPPEGGRFVVTTAGSGDPTCVTGCSHFISDDSLRIEDGETHTVVLYDDSGSARAMRLWEDPPTEQPGAANAMEPADPAAGIAVVTAVALADADFGLHLSYAGIAGCQTSNLENIRVGGNQTPAYRYEGSSVDINLHDSMDLECAEPPVGGPFAVTGGPGTRTHVLLYGSPGAMSAVVLPMGDGTPGDSGGGDSGGGDSGEGDSGDGDVAAARSQMAAEVAGEFGLDAAMADCVAGLLVEAIGVDRLLDDTGTLVDLDSLPQDAQSAAGVALFEAVDSCGLDSAVFN